MLKRLGGAERPVELDGLRRGGRAVALPGHTSDHQQDQKRYDRTGVFGESQPVHRSSLNGDND
jgi:hypothetical protein